MIFVKGQGLLEADVNDLSGTGTDIVGDKYVRIGSEDQGYQWFLEEKYLEILNKPVTIAKENGSDLSVDYGVKDDDPLKDKIHTFESQENFIYQYQVSPITGYIRRVLVSKTPQTPMIAPDSYRFRPPKVRKGRIR